MASSRSWLEASLVWAQRRRHSAGPSTSSRHWRHTARHRVTSIRGGTWSRICSNNSGGSGLRSRAGPISDSCPGQEPDKPMAATPVPGPGQSCQWSWRMAKASWDPWRRTSRRRKHCETWGFSWLRSPSPQTWASCSAGMGSWEAGGPAGEPSWHPRLYPQASRTTAIKRPGAGLAPTVTSASGVSEDGWGEQRAGLA